MRKGNVSYKSRRYFSVLIVLSICGTICLAGCSNTEVSEPVDTKEETTVEESTAQQDIDEETFPENSAEESAPESAEMTVIEEAENQELSDEEGFKSLNLTDARFMIFNSTTGERKLLENGQQYTLLDGDELACWYPLDWHFVGLDPAPLYSDTEFKFDCGFLDLNYEFIGENSELTLHVKDTDGNDVYATVYLSK